MQMPVVDQIALEQYQSERFSLAEIGALFRQCPISRWNPIRSVEKFSRRKPARSGKAASFSCSSGAGSFWLYRSKRPANRPAAADRILPQSGRPDKFEVRHCREKIDLHLFNMPGDSRKIKCTPAKTSGLHRPRIMES